MERVFGKDRGSMGRFFRMLQKARLPYLWILACIAITALLSNVGISVTEYTAELFAGNVNFGTVVLPFLAFTLLSQLINSVSKIMSNLCVARIDRNIRKMIWSKTVRLPLRYYEKNKPKEMISRITTDITAISQLIMQVFVAILTSTYTLVITLGKIGSYDQKLMIALIAVLPLNLVIAFVMGKMKFGVLDLVNQKNAELTQTIAEKTNNLLLIKSYGKEEKELQTGREKMKELYKSSILNAWLGFATPMYAVYILMQAIMGEDEAPMKKGLIQSLGIPEIQYFIMDGIRQPYLAVKIKNTDKETAGRLKTVITEQADRLCREGIGEEVLVSAINRLEFWMREKGGSQPEGIEYVLDIAGGWAQGTRPCEMIEFEETYRKMRTLVKEGYFESLLREILLENDYEAEVSLEPLERAEEKGQEEETEDLPGLSADDLLHKKEEPLTRAEEESGITYLKQEIPSKGVVYQSCYFDISDLEPEKVPYAKLFSELLGSLPTRTHSLEELVIEKNMWLGNIRAYLEAYTNADDIRHVRLKFAMDISCLEQNLMRAVKLGEELLYDTILEHPEIILKRIRQSRMELERSTMAIRTAKVREAIL